MGIPYSKQINTAFEQVTPLVAEGFEVLESTKNITLFVAGLQICSTIFLGMILFTLVGISIIVNPDLESERQTLVTPIMKWFTSAIIEGRVVWLWLFVVLIALAGAVLGYAGYVRKAGVEEALKREENGELADSGQGEDVKAVEKGDTDQ